MQRSGTRLNLEHVTSAKRRSHQVFVWHDSYYLTLFGMLFLAGLTIGAVLIKNGASQYLVENFSKLTGTALSSRTEQGFFYAFFYQCFPLLITLIILYFSGVCALSQPLILFVPVFRGLGIGACMGYLYAQYGGKCILYSGFVVFPGAFVGMMAMLYACREAFKYSVHCFSLLSAQDKSENEKGVSVQKYSARFLFYAVVSLILLVICTGISTGFLIFFSL